jgi:RNA polymerase sigma-70 factor, ECF subfamily
VSEWSSNISAGTDAGGQRASSPPSDDAALLDRCRKGERSAFGPLVARYGDRVLNAILRLCGNRDDAEELCQETFVRALESLGSFRQDSGFYTWLFRIAVNLTISHRRRGGRVKFHPLEGGQGDGDMSLRDTLSDPAQADPGQQASDADVHRVVKKCLGELDEEFRCVVVLRDIEEMNYEQISDVLDIPVGTVKSRLYRARCLLREKLKDLAS